MQRTTGEENEGEGRRRRSENERLGVHPRDNKVEWTALQDNPADTRHPLFKLLTLAITTVRHCLTMVFLEDFSFYICAGAAIRGMWGSYDKVQRHLTTQPNGKDLQNTSAEYTRSMKQTKITP